MKLNAKYVVFSLIAVASTYVLYHNERFLVDSSHPVWQHYEPFKWWLLPHGVFGAIVLLFAPFQFSDRLRTTIYPSAWRYGTTVCAWSIRSRAPRCLHPVLPGAVWSASFLHGSGISGRPHAYWRHGLRWSIRIQTQNRTASPVGHTQLCHLAGLHCRALCFGSDGMGSA